MWSDSCTAPLLQIWPGVYLLVSKGLSKMGWTGWWAIVWTSNLSAQRFPYKDNSATEIQRHLLFFKTLNGLWNHHLKFTSKTEWQAAPYYNIVAYTVLCLFIKAAATLVHLANFYLCRYGNLTYWIYTTKSNYKSWLHYKMTPRCFCKFIFILP